MYGGLVTLFFISLALATPLPPRSKTDVENFRNFLKSTQNPEATSYGKAAQNRNNPYPEMFNGRFQGDILLDDRMVDSFTDQYALGRNAYIYEGTRWPGNEIPYLLREGYFDKAQEAAILDGINDINNRTCLFLRPRTPNDVYYVSFQGEPTGCWAHVGFFEPRRVSQVNLQLFEPGSGCFRHSTIVHELLHILGFFHMQSTYNRDDYVRIAWENIQPGMEHNFDIYENDVVDNLGAEYEYTSCMHYPPGGFSINGEPTIVALREFEGVMGQREIVTELDWLRLNRHYNCPIHWN